MNELVYDFATLIDRSTIKAYREFIAGNMEWEHYNKTVNELREIIVSKLPAGMGELMEQYDEINASREAFLQTMNYMAGFNDARRLSDLLNNPTPAIFPNWGNPYKEECKEVLEKARRIADGEKS